MARLGMYRLGDARLGEAVFGDSVEGGQSIQWKQEVELAPSQDWPVIIDMEIRLKFLDASKIESYNFTVDGDCTTDVQWSIKDVDNETGEVFIDLDVKVDCPDSKTWSGSLTGDIDYDGENGITGDDPGDPSLKDGSDDGFESSGSADGSTSVGPSSPVSHPGSNYEFDPSLISLGHSCTPSGHTATLPVTFNEDSPTKHYQLTVEWDPAKLEYAGYNGTPPDYTDDNNSKAYYFESATVDASSGRLVMTATDDETITPNATSSSYDGYQSSYLGSLQFNVLADQGASPGLTIVEDDTYLEDSDGRTLGPKTYNGGSITVENGLSIGSDTARPDNNLAVPVQIQAGTDVKSYDLTIRFPYEFVEFTSAAGIDFPDPETSVDVVEVDISGDSQDPIYRKYGHLHLSAESGGGVRDPHICDVTFTARIPYFSAGEDSNLTLRSVNIVGPDGSDIPVNCNSPGSLTVTNPPGTTKDSIPCDSINAYPVSVTRTFIVSDLDTDSLTDIKVSVESDTNPTTVDRNWTAIPYDGDSSTAAVNATITVEESDGMQECPADITTFIKFYWEDGSVTKSGLYAGEGVHYGGVKGLFGGSSMSTMGNKKGNFGPGWLF